MYCLKTTFRLCGACLVLFAVTAIFGCHTCNEITPGAIPQPNGTYDCQWIHAQRTRAAQDNFVIYDYEWSADVTKLTPFGQGHVSQIAQAACHVPFPIVIEPSSDRRLDELRRMAVLETLASSGTPVPPDRVILGRPEAEGLYSQEAPGIVRGMFGTQAGGQSAGAGTSGTGATSGGTQGSMNGGTIGGAGTGVGIGVGTGVY